MNDNNYLNLSQAAEAYNNLSDAVDAFIQLFNPWIMEQDRKIQLSSALRFGSEYKKVVDLMYEKKEAE